MRNRSGCSAGGSVLTKSLDLSGISGESHMRQCPPLPRTGRGQLTSSSRGGPQDVEARPMQSCENDCDWSLVEAIFPSAHGWDAFATRNDMKSMLEFRKSGSVDVKMRTKNTKESPLTIVLSLLSGRCHGCIGRKERP